MTAPLRPLAVASVVRQRLGGDRGAAVVYALRLLPAGWRVTGARVMLRTPGSSPAARAIASYTVGDTAAAATALLAGPVPPRRLPFRISLAVAFGLADTARELLARLPAEHRERPRLAALQYWHDGAQDAAVSVLAGAPGTGGAARQAAALRRRLQAEVSILQPGWRPRPAPPLRRLDAVPRRVLHLLTNALPTTRAGYTIRSQLILSSQRRASIDAHGVTRLGYPMTAGVPRPAAVETVEGVPYHRLLPARGLPRHADDALALSVELAGGLVERLEPAVLHPATNHVNGQIALMLRERYGIPVVYEVRGFLEESWLSRTSSDGTDSDRYRRSREMETYCMQEADLVVTLGAAMKADIVGRGVPASRVVVVPNAVTERFLLDPTDPAAVRRRLGIHGGEWLVGSVSTLAAHEGLDTLVRAVALLRGSGVPVRLVLVGEGPESAVLRTLAADLGITDAVAMPGWVPYAEVRDWYSALDVFAVPRIDARVSHLVTPLKPVEAMALARPVVASDVGGLADIITPGRTGLLARPGDPAGLAAVLEELLRDERLRVEIGAAARAWVAAHRSWSSNADRYRRAYCNLLGSG